MAITDVQVIHESGRRNREGRFYTKTFLVVTDDATTSIPAILTASEGGVSIPTIGTVHDDDFSATVQEIGPPQRVDDYIWHVPVRYGRPTADTPEEDPLDDPVRPQWGFVAYSQAIEKTNAGASVKNSAKDPFEPQREMDKHYLCVTLVRNEATYNPAWANNYMDSVNSTACTIAGLYVGTRMAKVAEFSATESERNGVEYYAVTYRIEFNPDTWDENFLDWGLNSYIAGKKKRIKEVDAEGEEPVEVVVPVHLDGSGAINPATSAAVYLDFRVRDELDFNLLGLNI